MAAPKAIPTAPSVSVANNCGSSTLTASGFTGSLLWSTGATTASITVTTAGTYTVTQTVNGCTSANGSGVAAPKAIPTAPTIGTITQPTCPSGTGSVILGGLPASGTWTLTRSPGSVITTGTGTSTTISGLAPGTYTFKVTNADGCISSSSANVVINTAPADVTPPTITCPGNISQTLTGPNKCSVSIAVPNPIIGDNCGVTTLYWVMTGASNGFSATTGINYVGTQSFNVGMTTIKYTVKDAAGNTSTCQFAVTIINSKCPNSSAIITSTPVINGNLGTQETVNVLRIKVMPNPSTTYFTLAIKSSKEDKVKLRVTDLLGRVIEVKPDIIPNGTIQLGSNYFPGTYIVEIIQGNEKRVVKLFKIYR